MIDGNTIAKLIGALNKLSESTYKLTKDNEAFYLWQNNAMIFTDRYYSLLTNELIRLIKVEINNLVN